MRTMVRMFALFVVVALVVALDLRVAEAHEFRQVVDGRYGVEVGFLEEPAFAGEMNSLYLLVTSTAPAAEEPAGATPEGHDEEEPSGVAVEGLEASVQAEVIYGDQRMSLVVSPTPGEPGLYRSYFVPTAEGDYSFRIFGTIEGVAIDETFTSGPDTFGAVQPRLEFPSATARVDGSDDTAGLPAISGALALAGLAIGGVAYTRRRSAG